MRNIQVLSLRQKEEAEEGGSGGGMRRSTSLLQRRRSPIQGAAGQQGEQRPATRRVAESLLRRAESVQGGQGTRAGSLNEAGDLKILRLEEEQEEEERERLTASPWRTSTRILTCCCLPGLLSLCCGLKGRNVQQAWREKVTLCLIIGCVMLLVAYFTVGLRQNICIANSQGSPYFQQNAQNQQIIPWRSEVLVQGVTYDFSAMKSLLAGLQAPNQPVLLTADWYGQDISRLFDLGGHEACSSFLSTASAATPCLVPDPSFPNSPALEVTGTTCLSPSLLSNIPSNGPLTMNWQDITYFNGSSSYLVVYDSYVLNLTSFFQNDLVNGAIVNIPALAIGRLVPGTDATLAMSSKGSTLLFARCLVSRYTIAYISSDTFGCSVYYSLMTLALTAVLGVILTRFMMALLFHWVISPRISAAPPNSKKFKNMNSSSTLIYANPMSLHSQSSPNNHNVSYTTAQQQLNSSSFFLAKDSPNDKGPMFVQGWKRDLGLASDMYTICMVTCYSEDQNSIKSTLDAIAGTDYPDNLKLLFVICDGLIQGAGNDKTTPEIVVGMIDLEGSDSDPEPVSYLAIADGVKQHNMAKVYAGKYYYRQKPVPIVVVVKCGTEEERAASSPQELAKKKAGNRGKRDSQLILMHFLQRVTFNDRMTALDFDLFCKIQSITNGVTADKYELLFMVDADTVVDTTSLRYMVQTMVNDPFVMGLCGETRIANKTQSWVTMIQVYEYFTNHNLGKAFESAFGGVTCLPGCFCMYRIKAKKGKEFVPLIVNPDIVACYSENLVNTLHKKNLLLLGEDRFLSTLMLGTFPQRKMVFVPQAICHTTVPHTYKMLQSQRRRWINSTLHNLLELVLLPTLCGTFCLSMQFVIALELFGTVSLPVAVFLTYYLIIEVFMTGSANILPLSLMLISLFLPGVLVVITTKKPVYVLWMFVYLLAIPVWNMFLPLYAFWHFDDFSWGDTRKIQGEGKQKDESGHKGSYEIGSVPLKRWEEWEIIRRLNQTLPSPPVPDKSLLINNAPILNDLPPSWNLDNSFADRYDFQTANSFADANNPDAIIDDWRVVRPNNSSALTPLVPVNNPRNLDHITSHFEDSHEWSKPMTVIQNASPVSEQNLASSSRSKNNNILNSKASRDTIGSDIEVPSASEFPQLSHSRLKEVASSSSISSKKPNLPKSNSTSESSLPIKAGDTINKYWKSLFLDQFQNNTSASSSQKLPESGSSSSSSNLTPQASDFLQSDVSDLAKTAPPVIAVVNTEKNLPDFQSQQPPSIAHISNIHSPPGEEVDASYLSWQASKNDTHESLSSFVTARQSTSMFSLDPSHPQEGKENNNNSLHSNRSSLVLGSRPLPDYLISHEEEENHSQPAALDDRQYPQSEEEEVENEEVLNFDIADAAKTSTTTQAFKAMFSSLFSQQSDMPASSTVSSSLGRHSRVAGPRDFDDSLSRHVHSRTIDSKQSSSSSIETSNSRVHGSRPFMP